MREPSELESKALDNAMKIMGDMGLSDEDYEPITDSFIDGFLHAIEIAERNMTVKHESLTVIQYQIEGMMTLVDALREYAGRGK